MPEAVIVATARSPIGRANKGSLKDMRPDELTAQIYTCGVWRSCVWYQHDLVFKQDIQVPKS